MKPQIVNVESGAVYSTWDSIVSAGAAQEYGLSPFGNYIPIMNDGGVAPPSLVEQARYDSFFNRHSASESSLGFHWECVEERLPADAAEGDTCEIDYAGGSGWYQAHYTWRDGRWEEDWDTGPNY